tara:strand:- start:303 stop:989 length:687 start_codon:yes stop_codon:yes gene_type:complete
MQNFTTDLIKSKWTETALRVYMEIYQSCYVQQMDHRIFPYDLTVVTPKHQKLKYSNQWNIECKALDWNQRGHTDAVLEIWQDNAMTIRPQWFQYNEQIDMVVFINMKTYTAHWYSAKKLKDKFIKLESNGLQPHCAHYGATNRSACPGHIYKVPYKNKDYGWVWECMLDDILFYTGHMLVPEVKQHPALKAIWDKLTKFHFTRLKQEHPESYKDIHEEMKTKILKLAS